MKSGFGKIAATTTAAAAAILLTAGTASASTATSSAARAQVPLPASQVSATRATAPAPAQPSLSLATPATTCSTAWQFFPYADGYGTVDTIEGGVLYDGGEGSNWCESATKGWREWVYDGSSNCLAWNNSEEYFDLHACNGDNYELFYPYACPDGFDCIENDYAVEDSVTDFGYESYPFLDPYNDSNPYQWFEILKAG